MSDMIIKRVAYDGRIMYRKGENDWVDDPVKAKDYSHDMVLAQALVETRNEAFVSRSYSLEEREAQVVAYAARTKAATKLSA